MQCSQPDINKAIISPPSRSIKFGQSYQVRCEPGYRVSGESVIQCIGQDSFNNTPTCIGNCIFLIYNKISFYFIFTQ